MTVLYLNLCYNKMFFKATAMYFYFWISGKGVHMCKGVGVHFADFISFFLNIP